MAKVFLYQHVNIYFDGACKNTAGLKTPTGLGVYCPFGSSDAERFYIAEGAGLGTSNSAEWCALVRALKLAVEINKLPGKKKLFTFKGDSQLIINQFTGVYGIKVDSLKPYKKEADELREQLGEAFKEIVWIPREQNTIADGQSKIGLGMARAEQGLLEKGTPAVVKIYTYQELLQSLKTQK